MIRIVARSDLVWGIQTFLVCIYGGAHANHESLNQCQ